MCAHLRLHHTTYWIGIEMAIALSADFESYLVVTSADGTTGVCNRLPRRAVWVCSVTAKSQCLCIESAGNCKLDSHKRHAHVHAHDVQDTFKLVNVNGQLFTAS